MWFYGFVGLIVKADDVGLHMAKENHHPVKFLPHPLKVLGYIGTTAMLWVGAETIAHGSPFTSHALDDLERPLAPCHPPQ